MVTTINTTKRGGLIMAKTPTNTPESITGTVVNSNDYILKNKAAYLQYIRENIQRIIAEDGLHYSEPMDKKKEYPAFTYIQFQYLLQRVQDEVYHTNKDLLYNNINRYDMDKVKLCYTVYSMLCSYYGFICSLEGFYLFSGIDEPRLKEWLSAGVSDVYKIATEKAKNSVVSSFENSQVPLLKLAGANYKYKLNTPLEERAEVAAVDVLPDLQALTQRKMGVLKAPDMN